MVRLVKRRTNQIVHRGVNNHESLLAIALHIQHARHQRAGLRYQKAPRLNQQPPIEIAQRAIERVRILLDLGLCIKCAIVIVNPQPAARIDRLKHDALAPQLPHQLAHPLDRRSKRFSAANLRSNMNADAVRVEPAVSRRALVEGSRIPNVDPEFVLAQAG